MDPIKVTIHRDEESDQGTFGTWMMASPQFSCKTAELPWKDNKVGKSRIPAGTYLAQLNTHSKFGQVYKLQNVPNRDDVEIHNGNFAGDVDKLLAIANPKNVSQEHADSIRYRSDVEGCIVLGSNVALFPDKDSSPSQLGVVNSKATLAQLMILTKGQDLELTIVDIGTES